MKYTAFVPARSGSKRLPNKNIRLLAGKPLLAWTLEACAAAKGIDSIILSTDSYEYWDLAQEFVSPDRLSLDFRSSEQAGDNVRIFDYLKSERSKIFEDRKGAFVLTLPTVPLRSSRLIEEALSQFEREGLPVFSVTTYEFPVSFALTIDEQGGWSPLFESSPMVTGDTRSQDQQHAYHPNGAIYVRKIADLAQVELKSLYEDATPYLMDRRVSVDIDNETDFLVAEALL